MLSDTYQLVHSLSKTEKRYFQRTASLHTLGEKNSYLKLFEALNRQKQLDEAEIKNAFRGQHLYLLKRHLYKSILRSLHSFHSATSIAIQVFSMISESDLLYKKGLTKAALKLVHHAKKIASRQELHLPLAQLMELEIRILASSQQLEQAEAKMSEAFEQAGKQIELYRNFQSCFQFRMNVSSVHNKEILFRQPDEQKKYAEEIKKLLSKELSQKAQWQLYNGAGTFYSATGNHKKGQAYHKKAAVVSEKLSSGMNDEVRQYLLSLYTQSISYFYLKQYDAALANLENLETIFSTLSGSANSKNIRELYLHSLLLEGFIRMDMNAFDKARPVILRLKKETELLNFTNVSLKNDIYYQQAGFWFCIGDFKEAQSWVSKILQDEYAPKENPGRYRFARLMQLLVLLELDELDQIEDLLPATRKFLKRKGLNFKIEDTLIRFISNYVRSKEFHSKKFRLQKFTELKKDLTRIAKDKNEAASLRVFDYIAWTQAKREGRTMAGGKN